MEITAQAFLVADRDGDGFLAPAEVRGALQSLGLPLPAAEVMKALGSRGLARANMAEFQELYAAIASRAVSRAEVMAAFKVLDPTGRGKVRTAEVRHLLTNIGEKMSESELDSVLPDEKWLEYETFIDTLIGLQKSRKAVLK